MQNKQLNRDDIATIKAFAREKLIAYCKLNTVIGAQIFNILEKESKVLYYPLEDQKVWGFSEVIQGKAFVCINTSLDFEKQVFVAAHELYHLWYGTSGEIMLSKDEKEPAYDQEVELWANRFAAEFLVNEELLLQEMRTYGIDKDNISGRDVIKLANIFVVPYRTMARRLREIGIVYYDEYDRLMTYAEKLAEITQKRMALTVQERKEQIVLSNLVDKAMELYEKKLITYDKLEYLLGLSELTPAEMGIGKGREEPKVPNRVSNILKEFSDEMSAVYGKNLKNIILYGSYARGDYTETSDVDIMILVSLTEDEIKRTEDGVSDSAFEYMMKYGIEISPIVKNVDHFMYWVDALPFYRNVRDEGVELIA